MNTMYPSEQAIDLILNSSKIVALSGAGISTEAGIPDFRSPGGVYNNSDAMEWLSASGFRRDPAAFYRASRDLFSKMACAEPTLAHQLLVRLEQMGKLTAVVTQNIDGLHHAAGSAKIHELHGTYRTGRCTRCGAEFEMAPFYSAIESGQIRVPLCPPCEAPIKPDIVLFEELLPVDAWEGAVAAAEHCDLMLVFGSSLMVYPAAQLPSIAISGGAKLVIVNMEPTTFDSLAAVAVRDRLGDFSRLALETLAVSAAKSPQA